MPRLASLTPVERLRAISPRLDLPDGQLKRALRPHQLTVRIGKSTGRRISASEARLSRLVMLLDCFDRCVEGLVGYKTHIYLLGDESVGQLVSVMADGEPMKADRVSEDLEVLSTCGLVYRFNVALKFGYADRSLVQVRLNGWGRHLVDSAKWSRTEPYRQSCERIMAVVAPFAEAYREQIKLCGSDERPLQVRRIHLLNRKLPISVVT